MLEAQLTKPAEDDYSYLTEPVVANKDVDTLKGEVEALRNQLKAVSEFTEKNALTQEMKQLKTSFPAMNNEHVLAIKKLRPDLALDECAKHSHDMFLSHAKETYQSMLEKKKADAETKKVTGPERIRNLKPGEAPKDLDKAKELMMKFMKDD
jgi:hypothetical protein